jgi:hypothetical protein
MNRASPPGNDPGRRGSIQPAPNEQTIQQKSTLIILGGGYRPSRRRRKSAPERFRSTGLMQNIGNGLKTRRGLSQRNGNGNYVTPRLLNIYPRHGSFRQRSLWEIWPELVRGKIGGEQ